MLEDVFLEDWKKGNAVPVNYFIEKKMFAE